MTISDVQKITLQTVKPFAKQQLTFWFKWSKPHDVLVVKIAS